MKFQLVIQKRVLKDLEKVDDPDYSRLKKAILALADNPRPFGHMKLKGRSGYRIRVGNYRVIYEINDAILIVDVIAMGNRKDIYE